MRRHQESGVQSVVTQVKSTGELNESRRHSVVQASGKWHKVLPSQLVLFHVLRSTVPARTNSIAFCLARPAAIATGTKG
jgi:hypothetical protein